MVVRLSRWARDLLRLVYEEAEAKAARMGVAVTNVEVILDNQMAKAAGLEYVGSDRYAEAINQLLAEGVLERGGGQEDEMLSSLPGGQPYGNAFRITPHGIAEL